MDKTARNTAEPVSLLEFSSSAAPLAAMTCGDASLMASLAGRGVDWPMLLREILKNGMDAADRRGCDTALPIVLDLASRHLPPGFLDGMAAKLAGIDPGGGMTGPEMVELLNKIASSAKANDHSLSGNFGVGIKTTVLPLNPFGVLFVSWLPGQEKGAWCLLRAENGRFGLKTHRMPDGSSREWGEIDGWTSPRIRRSAGGTIVVLLGMDAAHDTTLPPADLPGGNLWLQRVANTRFFDLGRRVVIQSDLSYDPENGDGGRVGWARGDIPSEVVGAKAYLDRLCATDAEGAPCEPRFAAVPIRLGKKSPSYEVLVWVLGKRPKNAHVNYPSCSFAHLFQNEAIGLRTRRDNAHAMLNRFDVRHGHDSVVLMVRVVEEAFGRDEIGCSANRMGLVMSNGREIPLDAVAAEFSEKLPSFLREHIEANRPKGHFGSTFSVGAFLLRSQAFLTGSFWRRNSGAAACPEGSAYMEAGRSGEAFDPTARAASSDAAPSGGSAAGSGSGEAPSTGTEEGSASSGGRSDPADAVGDGGKIAKATPPKVSKEEAERRIVERIAPPAVEWADGGSFEEGILASYDEAANRLLLNRDWPVIADTLAGVRAELRISDRHKADVASAGFDAYGRLILEAVIRARRTPGPLAGKLLTDESLTAAGLPFSPILDFVSAYSREHGLGRTLAA